MYTFWKCIEVDFCFFSFVVKQGSTNTSRTNIDVLQGFFFSYFKNLVIPYGDIILYALSTGYITWNAVIEPHTLREGYWKFLAGLTGNKSVIFVTCCFK